MRRRQFIALIAGAPAAGWALAAHAQQIATPVVGYLHANSFAASADQLAGFDKGLQEFGYVDGKNLTIEYRWADGDFSRLPTLAADLIKRRINVLVAGGGNAPGQAAKAATGDIPIVIVTGSDPIRAGLVASLARPGGNVTGVSMMLSSLAAKSLDIAHQLAPNAAVIGALVDSTYSDADLQLKELQDAAAAIKQNVEVARVSTAAEIEPAFATLAAKQAAALLIANTPMFNSDRNQILELAARHRLPTICSTNDWTKAGGLMSYAPSLTEAYRQAGIYAAKILKGAKAADLPVVQPTKFDLFINLKVARTLGVQIPANLLAIANEVIE